MNGPDGLEQRTADAQERSERELDRIDADEQRAEDERDSLITTQTQRILTGAAMLVMLCLTFTFGGCATLKRHPVLTAFGAAIIVGSIDATIEQHHDQQHVNRTIMPSRGPQCRNGVCGP